VVATEEVVRVVAAFQQDEPSVLVVPVGGADARRRLVGQEVDVDPAAVRPQRRPEPTDPVPVPRGLEVAGLPGGDDVDVVGGVPVGWAPASSPTRATAPPRANIVTAENGEVILAACSTITAIVWSVSGGSFQDLQ
jgi:hypothetical protein